MSDIAIKVENLTKRYRIGLKELQPETLAGAVTGWLKAPFQNYRKLSRLSHFSENGHDPDDVLWALKDVSFEVKHGEVVGIIGRNGAGKSTLLKILSRITEPTSGRVTINGRVASLLEVGTGFHPDLTGRENVYLNGTVLGMSKEEIHRKFDEIVDFSGVEKFIDTPVKRYSSGMQVRLAFSVAAHLEPEILLIDEVLAVGDVEFQKKCLGKMDDIAQTGRTVFFVSHNMAAIEHLCHRAFMLGNGKIEYSGKQTDVVSYYLTNFRNSSNLPQDQQNRAGSGLIRISNIEFRNKEGQALAIIQSGQDVDIYLHFLTDERFSRGDVNVGIRVTSQMDVPIFQQSSRLMNVTFEELPRSGIFVCRISNLPLPPSIYLVTPAIKVNEELSDQVPNGIEMTVIEGDFFGSGRSQDTRSGVCLIKGQWFLKVNNYAS